MSITKYIQQVSCSELLYFMLMFVTRSARAPTSLRQSTRLYTTAPSSLNYVYYDIYLPIV